MSNPTDRGSLAEQRDNFRESALYYAAQTGYRNIDRDRLADAEQRLRDVSYLLGYYRVMAEQSDDVVLGAAVAALRTVVLGEAGEQR